MTLKRMVSKRMSRKMRLKRTKKIVCMTRGFCYKHMMRRIQRCQRGFLTVTPKMMTHLIGLF